jgi:hypothetical protein
MFTLPPAGLTRSEVYSWDLWAGQLSALASILFCKVFAHILAHNL